MGRLAPLEASPPLEERERKHHHHHHHKKKKNPNEKSKGHEKLKCRPKEHLGEGYNKNVRLESLDTSPGAAKSGGKRAADPDAREKQPEIGPGGRRNADKKRVDDLVTTVDEAEKWLDEFHEGQSDIQKLEGKGLKANGMDMFTEHMGIVNDLYGAHRKQEREKLRKKQERTRRSLVGGRKPAYKYEDLPAPEAPLAQNLRASVCLRDLQAAKARKGGGKSRRSRASKIGMRALSFARLKKVRPIKDRAHVDKARPECEPIRFNANEQAKRCLCFTKNYQAYNDVGINDPLACACCHVLGLEELDLRALFHEFEREDADNSGTISEEEFLSLVGATDSGFTRSLIHSIVWGWAGLGDSLVRQMTFSDYVLAACTVCTLKRKQLLFLVFEMFDRDQSGSIDVAEFRKLDNIVRSLGGSLFPDDYAEFLDEYDRNGDNTVSFKEFLKLDDKFPMLFFPAHHLFEIFREKTLGETRWQALIDAYDGKCQTDRLRGADGVPLSFHDQIETLSRSKVGAPVAPTACVRSTAAYEWDFEAADAKYMGKRFGRNQDFTGEAIVDREKL